ncbi:hypothetical protein P167DRAFT_404831 [Morchella conica CCBAS932]|uniref:Fucose-specific lectin n=1 Tax=Morchella conica CCBAS932 TaxID=1392247 RepID=A0A3N4KAB7_9PEZI|nr:hypothetical protein P167DRAFT_404831 [Morchella conica CCBAS932]
MSGVSSNIAARTPLCSTLFFHTSHGLTEVHPVVFNLDAEGNLWRRGWGGEEKIDLSEDAKPHSTAGMAVLGRGSDIHSIFNMRLYYTNKDGKIFEHCYTQGRGWYQGALTGQFCAFPGSGLGVRGSDNGALTWLFYQDPETCGIHTMFRSSLDGAFEQTSVCFTPGMKCTEIAVDPKGNAGVFYQKPDGKITQAEATTPYEPFAGNTIYPPGTAIATTKDKMFCVTGDNKIEVNIYDPDSHKWQPPTVIEGVNVIPTAPLSANMHQPPRDGTYTITIITQKEKHEITKIGYTDPKNVVIATVN